MPDEHSGEISDSPIPCRGGWGSYASVQHGSDVSSHFDSLIRLACAYTSLDEGEARFSLSQALEPSTAANYRLTIPNLFSDQM